MKKIKTIEEFLMYNTKGYYLKALKREKIKMFYKEKKEDS